MPRRDDKLKPWKGRKLSKRAKRKKKDQGSSKNKGGSQ